MDLLIFDCDGVLIDSEVLATQVEVQRLRALGCNVTVEEYLANCVGRADGDVEALLKRRHNFQLPPDHWDDVHPLIFETFAKELRAIPGIEKLLSKLTTRKCVASNSHTDRLRYSLEITGLIQHFNDAVFSALMVARAKPAPDLFLYAAEKMGVQPKRCTVIEDSPAGVTGAVAAGMRVIGFVGASHKREGSDQELLRLGAEAVCSTTDELASLLNA